LWFQEGLSQGEPSGYRRSSRTASE